MATALTKLELAESHLKRVQEALWDDSPDWTALSIFGFHALENAVDAACLYLGTSLQKTHPARVAAARQLHEDHGFADVSELLHDLNETRKNESYGDDVPVPELDPEETATQVEGYVKTVREFLET